MLPYHVKMGVGLEPLQYFWSKAYSSWRCGRTTLCDEGAEEMGHFGSLGGCTWVLTAAEGTMDLPG